MEVIDRFQLPNSRHSNAVLKCFILGEAKGELSTGRAVIRAQRISCVRSNSLRVALDAPVQGWVVSEKDGRLGLAGKVVTKQGGKIALGLIANALRAAGEIGSQAEFTTVTTPLGEKKILTGSALRAAGYKALGETGKQTADWFMQRAKELYPVITVRAGEIGYFFLKKGLKIKIGGERFEEGSIISQLDVPAGK
jgi:conjugal transfer pilus assembly protein TraB